MSKGKHYSLELKPTPYPLRHLPSSTYCAECSLFHYIEDTGNDGSILLLLPNLDVYSLVETLWCVPLPLGSNVGFFFFFPPQLQGHFQQLKYLKEWAVERGDGDGCDRIMRKFSGMRLGRAKKLFQLGELRKKSCNNSSQPWIVRIGLAVCSLL